MSEKIVELFGGAITCALPTAAEDVSEMRQVPDNQEVYTEADTGSSFIVELLARHRDVEDGESGTFFFNDLAKANGCSDGQSRISAVNVLGPADYPNVAQRLISAAEESGRFCAFGVSVRGVQLVSKYTNEKDRENEVLVMLAVLRFPPLVSTDVLLSISAPQRIHPESSEARVVRRLRDEADVAAVMERMLKTFTVRNWELFVPEG